MFDDWGQPGCYHQTLRLTYSGEICLREAQGIPEIKRNELVNFIFDFILISDLLGKNNAEHWFSLMNTRSTFTVKVHVVFTVKIHEKQKGVI